MKKLFLFLVMASLVLGFASALNVFSQWSDRGTATAELSDQHTTSGTQSLKLEADKITGEIINEARVRITPTSKLNMADFESMSWDQHVTAGYMAHVDVFLDNGEVLIFEGAKSTAPNSGFCDVTPYPTGSLVTFGPDRGVEINDATYAWKNGDIPGPCGGDAFENIHKTLAQWKSKYPNAEILAFEIEVDGWIETSEAFIDTIKINGDVVENFDPIEQTTDVIVGPNLNLLPSPIPLSFGSLIPGGSSVRQVTLTPGTSDLIVNVNITGDALMQGILTDRTGSYMNLSGDSFTMSADTPLTFNAKLVVPVGTKAKPYNGQIVYTVNENPA